ncbi:hypothetical protein MKX01_004771 [Papaver californicum]|nr:hypothetical protein MKX01_004771 [Papaver californicum]
MASSVVHTSGGDVQIPTILTLKDFQLKHGIGPWMTRVRITCMWQELDFMRTNDVTSLDLLLIDDDGMLLDPWNTAVKPLEPSTASIPRHKFDFTEFEALATANDNIYLTDVVGVLISNTNLQQTSHRAPPCEITLLARVGY